MKIKRENEDGYSTKSKTNNTLLWNNFCFKDMSQTYKNILYLHSIRAERLVKGLKKKHDKKSRI